MKHSKHLIRTALLALVLINLNLSISHGATIVVTSTADSGVGTLRQAILDANADASPGAVMIEFNIAGTGVQTIAPLSGLPTITRSVTIDGYTQPGTSPNTLADADNAMLLIELSGASAGVSAYGLRLAADGCIVRGLVINRFSETAGLLVEFSDINVIEGNFIGTDASGTNALANAGGILLLGGAGHRVGGLTPASRNIVGGNSYVGIDFEGCVSNRVLGNFVGVGTDGVTALGNGNWSIFLSTCFQTQIGARRPGPAT